MTAKLCLLTAALLAGASTQAAAQAIDAAPAIYEDGQREIAVRFAFVSGAVEFSAYLPAGWSFSVQVDGDQNDAWGNGPEGTRLSGDTSGDRAFGQDSRNGVLCAQYILTSVPGRPEDIYASTECNGYPSQGRVEMTQLDERLRATITYRIPSAEIFGTRPDAHLRVCVWDGQRRTCQHSLARPFVLRNRIWGGLPEGR